MGGPVLIPGTHFNQNRNKLFFFTGFEYFYQVLDTGLLRCDGSHRRRTPAAISRPPRWRKEGAKTRLRQSRPGQVNAAALAFPGGHDSDLS